MPGDLIAALGELSRDLDVPFERDGGGHAGHVDPGVTEDSEESPHTGA